MNDDIRTQLPKCPLSYEVPHIPGNLHTALALEINIDNIDWQEKMLPWTLASLINNTDLVLQGVRLFIHCDCPETMERVETAVSLFDLPEDTIQGSTLPVLEVQFYRAYDNICTLDLNYWAFRGPGNNGDPAIKLPFGHLLRHNWGWGVADYSLHAANKGVLKDEWIGPKWKPLPPPKSKVSEKNNEKPHAASPKATLARSVDLEAEIRDRWLHAANLAVYGENYARHGKNVADYFFNASEPNWHVDTSICCMPSATIPEFYKWYGMWEWKIRFKAGVALYLLKTGRHPYNFKDSLMIETPADFNEIAETGVNPDLPPYPRLCNMKHINAEGFRFAMRQLMGAQLAMPVE